MKEKETKKIKTYQNELRNSFNELQIKFDELNNLILAKKELYTNKTLSLESHNIVTLIQDSLNLGIEKFIDNTIDNNIVKYNSLDKATESITETIKYIIEKLKTLIKYIYNLVIKFFNYISTLFNKYFNKNKEYEEFIDVICSNETGLEHFKGTIGNTTIITKEQIDAHLETLRRNKEFKTLIDKYVDNGGITIPTILNTIKIVKILYKVVNLDYKKFLSNTNVRFISKSEFNTKHRLLKNFSSSTTIAVNTIRNSVINCEISNINKYSNRDIKLLAINDWKNNINNILKNTSDIRFATHAIILTILQSIMLKEKPIVHKLLGSYFFFYNAILGDIKTYILNKTDDINNFLNNIHFLYGDMKLSNKFLNKILIHIDNNGNIHSLKPSSIVLENNTLLNLNYTVSDFSKNGTIRNKIDEHIELSDISNITKDIKESLDKIYNNLNKLNTSDFNQETEFIAAALKFNYTKLQISYNLLTAMSYSNLSLVNLYSECIENMVNKGIEELLPLLKYIKGQLK